MKDKKNVVIAILAVLVIALVVLFFITNSDKGKLADTNTALDTQVKTLSWTKPSRTRLTLPRRRSMKP